MNIIPSDKRIVIKPIKEDEKKNGLYMPESVKKPQYFFEVVQSSSDWYCKGDHVMPQKHAGQQFDHDGQHYIIVHQDEIVAKMKKD
jgi:co-chaperonin GroES (HSP10)